MATYYANGYTDPSYSSSLVGVLLTREFKFTVATALALNDLIKLAKIPPNVFVDDFMIDVPDLDTGGSPVIQIQIGDNDVAAQFITATAAGTAATHFTNGHANLVAAVLPKKYTAVNDLVIKVSTGPQTGATAVNITGWMQYHYFGLTSS